MPLAETIVNFYDRLKSATRGYASMDYDFAGYRPSKLVQAGCAGQQTSRRCPGDDCA
ncbi:MAG: hypothetical protein IPM76_23110 [Chloroflexi bacterium]|nr:hypothetical protein [Chloroflexota bacterium]